MKRKANPVLAVKLYGSKGKKKIDTAKDIEPFGKNTDVLHDAYLAWTSLDEFRRETRKLVEDKKPVTDWQLATFQNDYDPYKNPWLT